MVGEEATFHVRRLLDYGDFLELLGDRIENGPSDFRVDHLAASEHDGDFDLVAALEELLRVARLHLQVVRIDLGAHSNLAQDRGVLAFAGLALLLGLLVLELAVVEQAADRGHGVRRNFYEVEVGFARHFQGLWERDGTEPVSFIVDEEDFSGSDAVVDS